jgi:hypothetical protein
MQAWWMPPFDPLRCRLSNRVGRCSGAVASSAQPECAATESGIEEKHEAVERLTPDAHQIRFTFT